MVYLDILEANIRQSVSAKLTFLENKAQLDVFNNAVTAIVKCYLNNGRMYIAGNGGSAADAQHLAAEFVSRLAKDRDPLPAESLTVDSSVLTAIGNDYGYEKIFSRQIAGKMSRNDIFLGITTSGNSENIIEALDQCKKMKIPTVVLSGYDAGLAQKKANYCIRVTGERTSTIQEFHILLAHTICECVEKEIFNF
jgi:D-sedoheptulose 7-phosphate isomerase